MIQISVQNKIARLADPTSVIVCGNSDYVINFSFDAEWEEQTAKTARFTYNGGYTDVVFVGTQCAVPVLRNTDAVFVGVYAGDLHTTTPAFINCEKSILCRDGTPQPPTEDVYSQLMAMINGGMLKGEQGEKGEKGEKGERGDAGVIKFIPVNVLPTADIDGSAIYLVPIENSEEENKYTEYAYINGAWERLGEISVQVDHSEYAKKTEVVKKQTTTGRSYAYGYNPAGEYSFMIDAEGISAWSLAQRGAGGVLVVGTPTASTHATPKSYVDNGFIPKIQFASGRNRIYLCKPNGELQIVEVCSSGAIPTGYAIPLGNSVGNIGVATPTDDNHAANKGYVDNLPDNVTDETIKAKWRAWLGIE